MSHKIRTMSRRTMWLGRMLPALAAGLAVCTPAVAHAGRYSPPAGRYSYSLTMGGFTYGAWNVDHTPAPFGQGDKLIVRSNAGLFAITDKATLHAIAAAIDPMKRLSAEQSELGKKQGELGRQQRNIGAQQGVLSHEIADLARSMAHARGAALADLQRKMDAVGREQAELAQRQTALGRDQSAMGKHQENLGQRQVAESDLAEARINPIIDSAFSRKLAKRISLIPQAASAG